MAENFMGYLAIPDSQPQFWMVIVRDEVQVIATSDQFETLDQITTWVETQVPYGMTVEVWTGKRTTTFLKVRRG